MMAEALVIFACANSAGCQETSSRYYETHPEVREIIKQNETKIVNIIGPRVVETVGPFLYVITGGTGTVKLTKDFSLQMNLNSGTLTYVIGF